jgi:hypothetical protein
MAGFDTRYYDDAAEPPCHGRRWRQCRSIIRSQLLSVRPGDTKGGLRSNSITRQYAGIDGRIARRASFRQTCRTSKQLAIGDPGLLRAANGGYDERLM